MEMGIAMTVLMAAMMALMLGALIYGVVSSRRRGGGQAHAQHRHRLRRRASLPR